MLNLNPIHCVPSIRKVAGTTRINFYKRAILQQLLSSFCMTPFKTFCCFLMLSNQNKTSDSQAKSAAKTSQHRTLVALALCSNHPLYFESCFCSMGGNLHSYSRKNWMKQTRYGSQCHNLVETCRWRILHSSAEVSCFIHPIIDLNPCKASAVLHSSRDPKKWMSIKEGI